MTESQDHDQTGSAGGSASELAACRQQVADLTAELTKTFWEMGYFITMTCALGHLATPGCDCDERIAAVNARLRALEKRSRADALV